MRKKVLCLPLAAALLIPSGCSLAEGYLEEKIQEEFEEAAGENCQDYQKYQSMRDTDQLDEEGMYQEAEEDKESSGENREGMIRVTFSENSLLGVDYYYDEELTRPVDRENCYINPGDCVYASVEKRGEGDGTCPEEYEFSGFKVWDWDQEGGGHRELNIEGGQLPLVMTVPEGCRSTQLSVAPLGEYRKKTLSLKDSYMDAGGKEIELNGVWRLDSGGETTDAAMWVSPFSPYIVSYDYSGYMDEFYYEASSPQPFYVSGEEGMVQFEEGQETVYWVRLHPYIRVKLINNEANIVNSAISAVTGSSDIVRWVAVNGTARPGSGKKEQFIEKLKCGDRIQIQVGEGYKATARGLNEDSPRVDVKGGREYVFTVPQTSEAEPGIIISRDTAALEVYRQRTMDNARIVVRDGFGQPLTSGMEVEDTASVTVTITPALGYYITGRNVKDNIYQDTMKYARYVSDIDSIIGAHKVKKLCRVTLNSDDAYGVCIYKVDGKVVTGSVELRQEQKLKLEYTLTDETYQIVREQEGIGSAIEGVFSKNKTTAVIGITEDMNGAVISRQNYIQIEKK